MKALPAAFKASTILSLAGWAMLLGFPLWPQYASTVVPTLVVGLLCTIYVYLVFLGKRHDAPGMLVQGNFLSLTGIVSLFKSPRIVLAGWIHFLAFDLMVGLYIVTDAARHGISHWVLLPALLLTLIFGPAGLLLYLVMRCLLFPGMALFDLA